MAIMTPMMLSSVSWSPKTMAEMEMVVTSLKIPAIDNGMIPARWMMLFLVSYTASISHDGDGGFTSIRSQPSKMPDCPGRQWPVQ